MKDELKEIRLQLFERISFLASDNGMDGFSTGEGPASRMKSSVEGIIFSFHERSKQINAGLLFRNTMKSSPTYKLNLFRDKLETINFNGKTLIFKEEDTGGKTGKPTAARAYFVIDSWQRNNSSTESKSISEAVSAMRKLWDELPDLQPK